MAPREIVAVAVSALRLAENTTVDAERLVPLTFLVIVATVTDYGDSAPMGARWLGVATPNPQGFLVAAPLHGSGSWPGFSVTRRFLWWVGRSAIGTLVERKSRYVLLLELPDGRTAAHVLNLVAR